ncbi:ribonucleases P/MRP protein subunit POP1-domain-containing protein [Mycena floridula]|nr:ribonucleases P/MRP protein subunit POP1-domain-containing protein [Mycena floridula]
MPPKRKNGQEADDGPTGRERKKAKIANARTIAVQFAPAPAQNPVAGPSRLAPSTEGMQGLPGAIDVEKFAESRAFEINAMQNAIQSASSSSTHRAWQLLPRHLRRRAASHDVRRVPLRLREKAKAEMDPSKKAKRIPKLGKTKRISKTELFRKRQREKTWLETHLWHAKRMKMADMWGYRLAVQPTEKSFRPSHRASVHGSIIHDASYMSLIELKGPENALKEVLEACCDPQGPGPGSKRYTHGARTLDSQLYKPGCYPFDLVGPITVIWRPTCLLPDLSPPDEPSETVSEDPVIPTTGATKKRTRRGAKPIPDDSRVVWVRCHPSLFDDIFSTLQSSISTVLDAAKRTSGSDIEVELGDLRGQVNSFDIMGPKASQVLKGVLNPVGQDKREEFRKFWSALTDLQTSASVPRGMIIGATVHDPRLKFPPKNAKATVSNLEQMPPATPTFPSAALAQSDIWSEATRTQLKNPRFKKKDLDERRSKSLIPGTHLTPSRQDNRIPILLIQRSLESSDSGDTGIHGWTVMIPAGWSMAFFPSLIFTGTRVGGQRECQTQSFEAGAPYFPRDYPTTSRYNEYAESTASQDKDLWSRKPASKRVNYEKLRIRSPWKPDWDVVLGLKSAPAPSGDSTDEDLLTTQRETEPVSVVVALDPSVRPWLLQGPDITNLLANMTRWSGSAAVLLEELNKLRNKRNIPPIETRLRDDVLRSALINVKVSMLTRGSPGDLAAIFGVPDDVVQRWSQKAKQKGIELAEEEESESSDSIPPPEQIIGYVTSGNFSLARGEGFAIGAIAVAKLLELYQQSERCII